jgi:hypothetical protein
MICTVKEGQYHGRRRRGIVETFAVIRRALA